MYLKKFEQSLVELLEALKNYNTQMGKVITGIQAQISDLERKVKEIQD